MFAYPAIVPSRTLPFYPSPYAAYERELERLAYLTQLREEKVCRAEAAARRAALAALAAEEQERRQKQVAFERAVRAEVERRLQQQEQALEEELAYRAALARRVEREREREAATRRQSLVDAARRHAAVAAAAREQSRPRIEGDQTQLRRLVEPRRVQRVRQVDSPASLLAALLAPAPLDVKSAREEGSAPALSIPVHTADKSEPQLTTAANAEPQSTELAAPAPPSPAPAAADAPSPVTPSATAKGQASQGNVALRRRFERKLARQAALDTLRRLAGELRSRQSIFASPPSLSFSPDASSPSPSSSTPSTPPLTFDKPNRAFLGHEEFLVSLLSEVDGVSSGGDKVVKRARKRLVKRIERELGKLDELREREWERQSQRRASEAGDATQDKVGEATAQRDPAEPADTTVTSTTAPDLAPLEQATTARPLAGESAMVSSDDSTGEIGNEASTLDVKPRPDTSAATSVDSTEAHEPAPQPVHSTTESDVPEPAPLTADSLAALSASTSTSAWLARRPSRASTTSVESETSSAVNGYVQDVLRRARDLGARFEREEQEEVEGKAPLDHAGFAEEDGRGAGAEDGGETVDREARGETGEDE